MTLGINETAAFDKVRLEASRGAHLQERFELYEDRNPVSCGVAVQGDPLDLSSYTTVVAAARVGGTDQSLFVNAALVDKGSATTPAKLSLFVDSVDLERCFAEGAAQNFTVAIVAIGGGKRDTIFKARVSVSDSAFGAA